MDDNSNNVLLFFNEVAFNRDVEVTADLANHFANFISELKSINLDFASSVKSVANFAEDPDWQSRVKKELIESSGIEWVKGLPINPEATGSLMGLPPSLITARDELLSDKLFKYYGRLETREGEIKIKKSWLDEHREYFSLYGSEWQKEALEDFKLFAEMANRIREKYSLNDRFNLLSSFSRWIDFNGEKYGAISPSVIKTWIKNKNLVS